MHEALQDTYSMEIAEGTRKRIRSASDGDGSGGGGGESSGAGCRPDRLSALPDCLLHVIMSSLKARQVVQTCVLSTRWRHLWRSVPCLDIDIAEFRTKAAAPDASNSNQDSKGNGWDEFEDFTVNLMLRCNIAMLDSFRLDIDRGWRHPPYSNAFSRSAEERWIYSGQQAAVWLRRAMKYCTAAGAGLDLRPSSWSWRLRRLHLCHIPLDDSFAEHLTSVCRSLEDLELDHCTCDCEIRSIASDSLKNLVLKSCSWGGFLCEIACPKLKTLVIDGGSNGEFCDKALDISAPMVAYLHLHVDGVGFRGGISLNEMPLLHRASIHLRGHKYSLLYKIMCGSKLGRDQSELLCALSNVTSLELLAVGTTVLGEEPKFLEFKNLRNLLLGDCDLSDDFRLLRFIHRGSPNLEKVTLRHCEFPGEKTSFSDCYGLDFLRDENVELRIIHKDADAAAVPNAATTDATEDFIPRSTGAGPRRGARHKTTSVRISGPEWERSM